MQRAKKDKILFFGYVSPWLVGFTCFGLFPLLYSLYMSCCNYTMGGTPKFNNFQNYIDLFTTETNFYRTFGNTFLYMGVTTVFGMVFGLFFSMLMTKVGNFGRIFQTIYYLPSVMPFIAGSMLWIAMYAKYGILNGIIKSFGGDRISFMSYENAMKSILVMSIWSGIGGKVTILLPAIAGVPKDMLESMDLDGANGFTKFIHAILPMISPTIFYLVTMDIIGGLQVYGPMMMLGGGTATITVTLTIYNYAMTDRMVGYASAYAWIVFAIVLAVTYVFFKFGGKEVYYADED